MLNWLTQDDKARQLAVLAEGEKKSKLSLKKEGNNEDQNGNWWNRKSTKKINEVKTKGSFNKTDKMEPVQLD